MKFIITLVLIALLSFVSCLYFPWWSIALVGLVVGAVIPVRSGQAFFAGFIALFLLWGGLSFWISNNNDHLLAHKISLVILKVDSPFLLILATALIGAIVAGIATLAGSYIRPSASDVTNHHNSIN